jgi:predicted GIY-YIG superfamily endonuclease
MSMSIDGAWKAGVWAQTVWAEGVWYEGAPVVPPTPTPQFGGGLSSSRNKRYYIERDGKRIFFTDTREVYDLLHHEEEKQVKKAKKAIKRVSRSDIAELITFGEINIPKPKLLMKFNDAGINREIDKINERINASFHNALIRHIEIMEEEDAFLELLFQ